MASNSKHTDWILETIDHLRRRKARPDLERICHVVRRRYGLIAAETEAKLEKLVDSEVVIKVDYKGSTSYRNAAKWRKSMLGCAVLNSTTISTKILQAILELSKEFVRNYIETQLQGDGSQDETESRVREFATETGASLESINAWLKTNCDGFDILRSPLTVVLKREIDAGRVKRLLSQNYVITTAQFQDVRDNIIKPLKTSKKCENKLLETSTASQSGPSGLALNEESSSVSSDSRPSSQTDHRTPAAGTTTPAQPARRGRPPKHRPPTSPPGSSDPTPTAATSSSSVTGSSVQSKLKRILPNSHNQTGDGPEQKVPKKMETRKTSTVGDPACDFCKLTSQSNPEGVAEALLLCKDCSSKAHPTCMNYSQLLASRAYRGPWQCMDCKTCCVCQDAGNPDEMLFCDGCDKGYHMGCHNPPVNKKPSGTWECSGCRLENLSLQRSEFMSRQGSHHTVSHESAPPTPAESPVPNNLISNGALQLPTKPCYVGVGKFPDAAAWSVNDVVDYFTSAGFVDEAQVFLEQEIDGVALLLLKRTDILRGLELKLGPALKLNRHIQGLQMVRQHDAA